LRYRALAAMRPTEAADLLRQAQAQVKEKYRSYEALAGLEVAPAAVQETGASIGEAQAVNSPVGGSKR
jgi:hypothetical protein